MNQTERKDWLDRLRADEHHQRQQEQPARAAVGRGHEPLRWERTHGEP